MPTIQPFSAYGFLNRSLSSNPSRSSSGPLPLSFGSASWGIGQDIKASKEALEYDGGTLGNVGVLNARYVQLANMSIKNLGADISRAGSHGDNFLRNVIVEDDLLSMGKQIRLEDTVVGENVTGNVVLGKGTVIDGTYQPYGINDLLIPSGATVHDISIPKSKKQDAFLFPGTMSSQLMTDGSLHLGRKYYLLGTNVDKSIGAYRITTSSSFIDNPETRIETLNDGTVYLNGIRESGTGPLLFNNRKYVPRIVGPGWTEQRVTIEKGAMVGTVKFDSGNGIVFLKKGAKRPTKVQGGIIIRES